MFVREKPNKSGLVSIRVIEKFRLKYDLPAPVVIADSGLLSKKNVGELRKKGYEFILGARLKGEVKDQKLNVRALEIGNGEGVLIDWVNDLKTGVNYSDKRSDKQRTGFKKLEKQLKTGKLNKYHVNRQSYKKYLKMEGGAGSQ